MRRLIIGDIHGCYAELQALLDKAGLAADDEIIALGDIVDRGPDSPRVLDFFTGALAARSLQGNHERKHVRSYQGQVRPALSQIITRAQISEDRYPAACATMARFPVSLDLPEAILAHGFYEPGAPLAEQRETVLVGTLSGESYLRQAYRWPWYELYDAPKPLVVGHRDYLETGQPLIYRDRVYGLDTGCCRGRALTGLLLPDFQIISVPARGDYWTALQTHYAHLKRTPTPDAALTWQSLAALVASAPQSPAVASAARERAVHLASLQAEAEQGLAALFTHVTRENARVLAELHAEAAFDTLTDREQGLLYAKRIGDTPLSSFLHKARRGELTQDALRRGFTTPHAVLTLAASLGLAGQSPDAG